MNSENDSISSNDSISFGRYLLKKRLDKGIPLKALAEETRIGLNTLVFIENENIEKLPAEVFTKGFLRAYAKAVGADADEAVRLYLREIKGFRKAEKFESDLSKTNLRFWPRLIGSLILLCGLIAGAVFLFAGPQDRLRLFDSQDLKPQGKPKEAVSRPAEKKDATPPAAVAGGNTPEKLLLKVAAAKSTWMKVIIDGQDTNEYRLSTGDQLELEAASGFNILIGDAKAVKLSLNNKPYPIPGKSGQVVTVQIP